MKIVMGILQAICLLVFAAGCGKKEQEQKVEGVFSDAIVADPEVAVIEKTFSPNFTGVVSKYYGEDSTRIDYLLVVQNGELKARYFFDRNRNLEEENHYDCRAMHGKQKRFYSNGKPKEVLEMDHGVRHGYHIAYDSTGRVIASERWKNGKPAGPIRVYDSLGEFSYYAHRDRYEELFLND